MGLGSEHRTEQVLAQHHKPDRGALGAPVYPTSHVAAHLNSFDGFSLKLSSLRFPSKSRSITTSNTTAVDFSQMSDRDLK